MAYVSARYAPPRDPEMVRAIVTPDNRAIAARIVIATDDEGKEWHLPEDSEVGDWLRYLKEGGTIDPAYAKEEKA